MLQIITKNQQFETNLASRQMNLSSKLECNLHGLSFSLYCDRCLEPVCQKCTFIGPHNTAIHSLTPLHQAYERRVQEVNARLARLADSRELALSRITGWANDIETLRLECKQIKVENDKNRAEIQNRLQKCYENIGSALAKEEELIMQCLNQINDLGHEFQTLSTTNDVECLINYQRIMGELREVVDQLEILMDKKVQLQELPKQLSEIRIKLKAIQSLKQLFVSKTEVIKSLITKASAQVKKIQTPKMDYEEMLVEINKLLGRYEQPAGQFSLSCEKPTLRKVHLVCNFCGIILDEYSINTTCTKNQLGEQTKSTESYYANLNKVEANKGGYCKTQPDVVSFGTHRHHFGEPANPNIFFRAAFLNLMVGEEVMGLLLSFLPGSAAELQVVNQSTKASNNSFANYLSLLFLKVLTLEKIKGKSMEGLLKKQDIGEGDQKTGYCQSVAMQYILMEVVGLQEKQANVIVDICDYATSEVKGSRAKGEAVRNYRQWVDSLRVFKI